MDLTKYNVARSTSGAPLEHLWSRYRCVLQKEYREGTKKRPPIRRKGISLIGFELRLSAAKSSSSFQHPQEGYVSVGKAHHARGAFLRLGLVTTSWV